VEFVRARAVQAGDQAGQGGIPPVQLEVKFGPAQPTPQGFIRTPVQFTQVRISKAAEEMSPAQREELQRSLAPLLEVQGWSEMDIQGRIRRSEFRGMEDVEPTLRTMLGNIRSALITVVLPDEPLGARASWEVERKLQFSGVWVDQVVTYEIQQMTQQELRLQVTARQTASPQAIDGGRLEAFEGSIIGSAVVRLENFTPYSEAEAISQMRIMTQTETGPELLHVDTSSIVKVYPAEDATQPSAETPPVPQK